MTGKAHQRLRLRPGRFHGLRPARSGLLLAAALLAVCATADAPAEAACAQSRPFLSNSAFNLDAETFLVTGVFWAKGAGNPASGVGIDNGLYSPGDAYYGIEGWAVDEGTSRLIGDWNQPGVDGCIDAAGATPQLTGDECMVVLLSDEYLPLNSTSSDQYDYGRFVLTAAPAVPGANPVFSIVMPDYPHFFAPIPKPTILDTEALGGLSQVTVGAGPGLIPDGLFLHSACADVPVGYRVFGLSVPAGAPRPEFLGLDHGWTPLAAVAPFGSPVTVPLDCTTGSDVYLSVVPSIDGGFMTHYVSGLSRKVDTATDTDHDAVPDACDTCTDLDADGFGDPGFLSNVCGQDNCPAQSNPSQADGDGDGVGDACEYCSMAPDPRPAPIFSGLGWNTETHMKKYVISDDGQRVVFEAFQEPGGFALYSVPVAGGPVIRLTAPLPPGRTFSTLAISPDSTHVVFEADRDVDERYEIFSVPIAGGVVRKLNHVILLDDPNLVEVTNIVGFGPDNSTLLFAADPDTPSIFDIYKVPVDGSSAPIAVTPALGISAWRLSPDRTTLVVWSMTDMYSLPSMGGTVTHMTALLGVEPIWTIRPALFSPDGQTFVFFQEFGDSVWLDERGALFSVPVSGGGSTQITGRMNIPDVQITPDNTTVVFNADFAGSPSQDELYRVGIAGGSVVKLNRPVSVSGVNEFSVSPDGAYVVYNAHLPVPINKDTLLSVPITGGASVQLNPSGEALYGTVYGGPPGFLITPDSQTVVYRMTPTPMLRSVSIHGGPSTPLSPVGHSVQFFARAVFPELTPEFPLLTPDGRTVVYRSSGSDRLLELRSASVSTGQILKLSDPFVRDDVFEMKMSRDGGHVVYKAAPGLHVTPVHTAADADGDALLDGCDNCPTSGNTAQADADGDGRGDICDNCAAAGNPGQGDLDGDGAGDACDCAANDAAMRAPEEVAGLALEHASLQVARLTWLGGPNMDRFAVTRGSVADLRAGRFGACLAGALTAATLDDASVPSPGEAWIYHVQGRSLSCGLGTMGFSSGGAERSNSDPAACAP